MLRQPLFSLVILLQLLLLGPWLISTHAARRQPKPSASDGPFCLFPEASDRPFFFDIRSDTPPRSIILDTVVEPSDARLSVANVRSSNLPSELDIGGWLSLEKRSNGQFLVFTADQPLGLPAYPSAINETSLYVTVRCNQRLYPLMTIRVRATNSHSPEWIGRRPFEMTIPKNAQPGAVFDTPLMALDLDPADRFPIHFAVEAPHDRDFSLLPVDRSSALSVAEQASLLANLPTSYSHRVEDWREQQFPPVIQLRVNGKLAKPIYFLNISITDNGQPEARRAWTQLKVSVKDLRETAARFSRVEYFGNFTKQLRPGDELVPSEPLLAIIGSQRAGDRIHYELDKSTNPYAQLFQMEPDTGRIRLAQAIPDGLPQTVELDVLARLVPKQANPAEDQQLVVTRTKLTLTDQTEVRLTYFAQCHYEAHLAENPSAFTRVLQFNFKGDVDGVELLNGSDLFKVDPYGQMSVRPGVNIDRESIDRIVVKARLRSKAALHPKSLELCQIATADILIDDVNDHSPHFTRRSYRFRIEPNPFNNTEVGSLRALDEDHGEFGRVRYRLLDEFVPDGQGGEEPLPFVLFQADGAATLFFVVKPLHLQLHQPYKPQAEYTFTVEAFDSEEDPRTARVSVNVRLEEAAQRNVDGGQQQETSERQELLLDSLAEPSPEAARDQPTEEEGESGERREAEEAAVEAAEALAEATAADEGQTSQRRSLPEGQPAKAMATRVHRVDGKESNHRPHQNRGAKSTFVEEQQPRVLFNQEHYTFWLGGGVGNLLEGQTIGWVRAKQQQPGIAGADNGGETKAEAQMPLEYAVEEGIAGFVGIDSADGRLWVGPHLVGDRFEEIRFTVAAQDPHDGRVWATALVSVLIDDSGGERPRFEHQVYHFQLELGPELATSWPRPLGQVHAIVSGGGNGSKADAQQQQQQQQQQPLFYSLVERGGGAAEADFHLDSQNGWLQALRDPPIGGQPIELEARACLRQNASSCGEAQVRVEILSKNASALLGKGVDFEQFRYELDLSDRQFVDRGTPLLQFRLRNSGAQQRKKATVHYRMLPAEATAASPLQESAIDADDLELDTDTGELRPRHSLAFSPTGPLHNGQFTVEAIEEDQTGLEAIVASTTLLVRSRSKEADPTGGGDGTAREEEPSIQFIPLPKTVFLAPSKPQGSTILRVSVRVQDPKDGSWHLLPLSVFQSGDGHQMQVDYSVEGPSAGQFTMRDNLLLLSRPLQPGQFDVTIKARLQRRRPLLAGEPAREEIRTSTAAQHPLHIVVMGQDGRQRYPVFERINYEFQIDPNAQFPLTFPPLNASLAGGQQIRFSLFPARSGDPTDGLEIHPQTGQLRVNRQFLGHFPEPGRGGEVFLVVRAVNEAAPQQFFSDAGVALVVLPKDSPPLQFDSPLYRFVLHEEQQPGSVVNGGASIHLLAPEQHPNARIRLTTAGDGSSSSWASHQHFSLLANGSLQLLKAVDLERMEDASRGIIQLEVIAEEESPTGSPSIAQARVEVQVLDQDEHVPDFVPLFPEFRLRLPINAGQPIGRLFARDEDFTDRQGSALAFRAISGNASRLVHVQRDGLLLVKDPNAEPGVHTLLVEVRDHDGLIARTTAKFAIDAGGAGGGNEGRAEGTKTAEVDGNQSAAGEETTTVPETETPSSGGFEGGDAGLDIKGTTVDVPLPASHEPNLPLFSVRDSIVDEGNQPKAAFRFVLEENPDGLFRLDGNSGELFLQEEAAFGAIPPPRLNGGEYELSVRIEQRQADRAELVARRVYTVRLVPMSSHDGTTTTTTTASSTSSEEEGIFAADQRTTTTATRSTTTKVTTPSAAETTTLAEEEEATTDDHRRTRWTLAQRTTTWSEEMAAEEEAGRNHLPGAGTTSTQQQQQSSRSSPPPPSARPLTRVRPQPPSSPPTQPTPVEEATTEQAITIEQPPAQQTQQPQRPQQHQQPHFSLARYHWVVDRPVPDGLVGRLEVEGAENGEESPPPPAMVIEPAQLRQWFHIDPQNGDLYLREVPDQLFGKQRAEFRVQLANNGGGDDGTEEAAVTVDLNLPPRPTTSTAPTITIEETEAGENGLGSGSSTSAPVEIAESSDQQDGGGGTLVRKPAATIHGTTLTAIDTRFTVSISPMHFASAKTEEVEDEQQEEEHKEATTAKTFTTKNVQSSSPPGPATVRWTNSAEEAEVHGSGSQQKEEQESSTTKVMTIRPNVDRQSTLKFGADEFKAMLPEGRYGNSGAQLSLRPHPLAQGMPSTVQYSIVEEQETGGGGQQPLPFYVHKDSGELIAFAEIDREERAKYQFRVQAFDPVRRESAETRVTVQILDVNDNFPQFMEPLVRVVAIGRLTPAGTRLAQFRAQDPDEGAHGRVSFRIEEDPSGGGWFRMDSGTGQLLLAKAVPTEEEDPRDMFELTISALDGGRPALRTEHHIRVEVFTDSDLAGPEFRRAEYDAGRVTAGAAQNGTFVWQVTAGPSVQFHYSLIDPPVAHLFVIDEKTGQIRMGRRPLDSERGRQWTLNVSAAEGEPGSSSSRAQQRAFTLVNVLLEPLPAEVEQSTAAGAGSTAKPPSPNGTASASGGGTSATTQCTFAERVFHAELPENTEGRQRLTTLRVIGCEGRRVHFAFNQQTNEAFELDSRSGELFAISPLDREKKSLHFLVVNISSVQSGQATVHEVELSKENQAKGESEEEEEKEGSEEERRAKRKQRESREQQQQPNNKGRGRELLFNGLVEQAKAKLADNQALVLVHVLDRNDNPPQFQQLSQEGGQIVFTVDWQSPVLQPIGRLQAHDLDEHPRLLFSLEGDGVGGGGGGVFSINASSGVIQLMKSLQTEPHDQFTMTASVGDGDHRVTAPMTVYKLQPGINIALLVINQPPEHVDVLRAVRHLNALLPGLDADVLVKQVYISDEGLADPQRTHLLVYALDKKTRAPVPASLLKDLLEGQLLNGSQNPSSAAITPASVPSLVSVDSPLRHLASVHVPDYASAAPFRLTSAEITLLVVSALLVFCVCGMLFMLLRCCKRRQELITKSDLEYMVDSQAAGPRPYNVELITRKTAQAAQQMASRRLPEPVEECTMTPESRATMVASSGIYGESQPLGLGGPLRRTARAAEISSTSAAEESSSSPMQLSNEQQNLLRPQRGRAGRIQERINQGYKSGASAGHQNDKPSPSSAENSPEVARIERGAPSREPPPPPVGSPPALRQQKLKKQQQIG